MININKLKQERNKWNKIKQHYKTFLKTKWLHENKELPIFLKTTLKMNILGFSDRSIIKQLVSF